MANEFFRAYGPDVAITMTPAAQGRMEVYVEGEKVFDKLEEGIYPDLSRVRQMKVIVQAKLDALLTPAD